MIYDDDADLHKLDGKTVAIIGYGSQGHAHALNLKDSGVTVVVGLRSDSSSVAKAKQHGLTVLDPADAASQGDLVMMLVPDELHGQVWESGVKDGIAAGNMLLFGHGFSIHYEQNRAAAGRRRGAGRAEGTRAPGTPAVHRRLGRAGPRRGPPRRDRRGAYSSRSRMRRESAAPVAAVIETTFKDETETDLSESRPSCAAA